MRAIDTNVLVRFLIGDDPKQARQAAAVVHGGDIYVTVTVMLETEWVLRGGYDLPAVAVLKGLRDFAGLPGVTVEEPAAVAKALDWMETGMDFADALHLARAGQCTAFVSFDRKLAKRAGKLQDVDIELLR